MKVYIEKYFLTTYSVYAKATVSIINEQQY